MLVAAAVRQHMIPCFKMTGVKQMNLFTCLFFISWTVSWPIRKCITSHV